MNRIFLIITLLSVVYNSFGQHDFSSDFYIFDNRGKLQRTIRFDEVRVGANDFIIVSKDGKYGIYNYKSNENVTGLIYRDVAAIYSNGLALVKNNNEKLGIIDLNNSNQEVLSFDYYNIIQLDDRYFTVTKFDRKWGVYDVLEKRFVIPCQYDSRIGLKDEVFVIKHRNEYAFYGKQGEIVMPFQRQKFFLDFVYPLANIHRNQKTLLFNTQTLEYQSDLEFDEYPIVFSNEYSIVTVKGKQRFLHYSGRFLTVNGFDEVDNFNDYGFAKAKLDGVWGVIDKQGNLVINYEYESKDSCPELFRDGLHTARVNNAAGVKKLDNTWLIEPSFSYFQFNENSIAAYDKHQAFSLFDYNGKLIKSLPTNESIEPFGNVYLYTKDGRMSWMDNKFKVVGEFADLISLEKVQNSTLIEVEMMTDGWRYGLINHKGKIVVSIENKMIITHYLPYNVLFVQKEDGKWGAYNSKGKEIIESKYERKINLNNGWSIFAE